MHISTRIFGLALLFAVVSTSGCPKPIQEEGGGSRPSTVQFLGEIAAGPVVLVANPDHGHQEVVQPVVIAEPGQFSFPVDFVEGTHELVFVRQDSGDEVARGEVNLPADGFTFVYVTDRAPAGGKIVTASLSAEELEILSENEDEAGLTATFAANEELSLLAWDETEGRYVAIADFDSEGEGWMDLSLDTGCYCVWDEALDDCGAIGTWNNPSSPLDEAFSAATLYWGDADLTESYGYRLALHNSHSMLDMQFGWTREYFLANGVELWTLDQDTSVLWTPIDGIACEIPEGWLQD